KSRSVIGRSRISYTEDDRVREILLPAQTKLWSSIGPFPADDSAKAFATAFEPEKDVKPEPLDLKKSYTKIVLPAAPENKGPGGTPPVLAAPLKAGDGPVKPSSDGKTDGASGSPKLEKIRKPAPQASKRGKDDPPAKNPAKHHA